MTDPTAPFGRRIWLEGALEGILEAGWLAVIVAMPLAVNPYSRGMFDPDKAALLRAVAVVMLASWLLKVASGGRPWRGLPAAAASRAPLAGIAVLVLASTLAAALFSIDPVRSWWGGDLRGMGALDGVAAIAVFGMALAHLREWRQLRRAVLALVLAGATVAILALAQHVAQDAATSVHGGRVGGTLGNPVFLAGWAAMVFFTVVVAAVPALSRVVAKTTVAGRFTASLQAASLLWVSGLLLAVIVVSGSRGGFLALVVSAWLVAAVASRGVPEGRTRRRLRWALAALGLAGVLVLAALAVPGSPLAPLRRLPYIERLGTVLDPSHVTTRMRRLTWRAAVDAAVDGRPPAAAGNPGRPRALRWLAGTGPSTFALATGPLQSAEIGRAAGEDTAVDRAHNRTLELLVTTGAAGASAWLALYAAMLIRATSLSGLGDPSRRRAVSACMLGAAGAGALAPVVAGMPELAAAGLPAGAVIGLGAWALAARGTAAARAPATRLLGAGLLGGVAAHLIEIHTSMVTVATLTLFWLLAAVTAAASAGWIPPEPEPGDEAGGDVVGTGLLAAMVMVVTAFPLLSNWSARSTALGVVTSSFEAAPAGGALAGGGLWVLVVPWLLAALLGTAGGSGGHPVRSLALFAVASLGPTAAYVILQASRLASSVEMRRSGAGSLEHALHVSGHPVWVMVTVLLLVVILGLRIAPAASGANQGRSRATLLRITASGIAITVVAAMVIARIAVAPVRADVLAKHGGALLAAGRSAEALAVLEHAVAVDPLQPAVHALTGAAALGSAVSAPGEERRRLLARAGRAMERAAELAPLD
ncbi:MAG TPA: hypothetical protein VLT32_15605, partial [Candidatus Sulfomarinibacteraceae bacterium]|nr:hypothetical protein [Candidatus Sulfomarinibacteraceae bacterium]